MNKNKRKAILILAMLGILAVPTYAKAEEVSGTAIEVSGTAIETSGTAIETGGTAIETSGTAIETSGTAIETSGSAIETSGSAIETPPEEPEKSPYVEGLNRIGGALYYYAYNSKGVLVKQKGLKTVAGKTYYFGTGGKAVTNTLKKVGKATYYFGKNGAAVKNQLRKVNKVPYYFDAKGKALTKKLKKVKKALYYFGSNGKAVKNRFQKVGSARYYFGSNYQAASGWITVKASCYYLDASSHKLKTNTVYDGYKLDVNGSSKTRYQIRKLVDQHTSKSMTKNQKIRALFQWLTGNSYTYTRTYEHALSSWKWYQGWTDDFASQLMTNCSGNCFRYSALLGYLFKEATGYEVKIFHGSTPSRSGGTTPHGWVTVKIGGTEYAFDPDLYKFSSKKAIYYYSPYSVTKRTIHLNGVSVKI